MPNAAARTEAGKFNNRTIIALFAIPFLLVGLGIATTFDWFPGPQYGIAWLALALAGVGVISFVAVYTDDGDVRTAIATSFVLTYFAVIFAGALNDTFEEKVTSGYAKDLLDSFKDLVALVVTFYITGKTVEKTSEKVAKARAAGPQQDLPDGPT
jgi:hypothetical protein